LREKHIVSELLNIEGVGKKRAEALYKHFLTIEDIKRADVDKLSEIKGISRTAAQKIYDYFHG
jgi:excinuclease ABC subunit C